MIQLINTNVFYKENIVFSFLFSFTLFFSLVLYVLFFFVGKVSEKREKPHVAKQQELSNHGYMFKVNALR
jgi:hypothetical protein